MSRALLRRLASVAGFATLSVVVPSAASAQAGVQQAGAPQTDSVYAASELTTPPKLASPSQTASLVRSSYPDALKKASVGGSVQLQFVVDQKGKVDPSSIEVVAASSPALGEAAKAIAARIEFVPGKMGTTPVRTAVLLPLTYRP
jgi:periplasmic protein TonB